METRKNQENYSCSTCAFTTVRKANYDRHLLSLTHKKEQEKNRIMCNFTFIP